MALQLLDLFPVLLLSHKKQAILVNTCEVMITPNCFEGLLTYDTSIQGEQNTSIQLQSTETLHTASTSNATGKKVGRPSLVTKFPGIIECTTEFIKQHGFSAHSHRCNETGGVGVSLVQIRDHLMQTIPGLKEHGLSKHAVAHLMEPPRRGTVAAKRYQGLVKARVPGEKCLWRGLP